MNDLAAPVPPPPLPEGFGIALDPGTRQLSDDLWYGGSPPRVVRLTGPGRAAFDDLRAGPVRDARTATLARRLTDAGVAHPVPPPGADAPDVTVVVPVRDRAAELERCLASLGDRYPVIVVDDGSTDPLSVARVVRAHGATLRRRPVNGGPGPARNLGLADVRTAYVAFADSDTEPGHAWIAPLVAHLADPAVAAVAPRVTALAAGTSAARYTAAHGSLDMGGSPARGAPGTRLSYVPTAALVARTNALRAVARDGDVFDPALRVGEDVDLVWRLHEAGWRVRFDPSVQVGHHEPTTWRGLLTRRFRYGTSAASLAERHPDDLAPLVISPWPAVTVGGALARRPELVALGFAGAVATTGLTLRRAKVPTHGLVRAMAAAVGQTALATARAATQLACPVLLAVLARPGRRHRLGRRAAATALLVGPALTSWAQGPRTLDPVRFAAGYVADELCYGAGVWTGCVRRRTSIPLRPTFTGTGLRAGARPTTPDPDRS